MIGARGFRGWPARGAVAAVVALVLTGGMALVGCGRNTPSSRAPGTENSASVAGDPSALRVVVLSEAHRFMAQRIGGHTVTVERVTLAAGHDRQLPPPRQAILAMQEADRILVNGIGQEHWLEMVSLPAGRVVELPAGLEDPPSGAGEVAHRHGSSGVVHRHAIATLPWLDLEAASRQAEQIRAALTALHPDQAGAFRERATELEEELSELDQQFKATTARLRDRIVLIVGDDLAAFNHRYGLNAGVLAERPEGAPALFLQELERKRGSGSDAVLLLTASVPPGLEAELSRRGVTVVVLQDALTAAEGETFPMQLRSNLDRLGALLQASGGGAGSHGSPPRRPASRLAVGLG